MSTKQQDPTTVLPPQDLEAMLDLSMFLDQLPSKAAAVLVGPDGQQVELPLEAFNALVQVAHAMRAGKAITVAPVDQLLTTQEAADFLGISRPTLVKLLTAGEIPYEQPAAGRHRRLRLQDVLEYQERSRRGRRHLLDEMTADAVAAGLYDADAEAYSDALREARRLVRSS